MKEYDDVKIFGFWVYLMTDLVIFAVLFATFIVLRTSTFGGPTGRELLNSLPLLRKRSYCSRAALLAQWRPLPFIENKKSWQFSGS